MNVLLIEDEELVRKTAVEWLQVAFLENKSNTKVFSAIDDKTALEILSKEKIDVVLMDMILKSSKSGIVDVEQLIRKIKATNKDIRVIAISGHVDNEVVVSCANTNMLESLIYKPVDYDELASIIEGKQ
jgi:DNA-binding NtrC family response regulator